MGISDKTIKENMKDEKGFRGVFTSDLLPKKIGNFESGIINLDISTGLGTHWVSYYNAPNYNYVEYFDPFGEYIYKNIKLKEKYIPENIMKFLKLSNKKINIAHNDSFLQKPTSVKCGLFCMKYIKERNKGKCPECVLNSFTQQPSDYNEELVSHL